MLSGIKNIFGVTGRPVLHSKSPYIFGLVSGAPYVRIAAENAREAYDTARSIGLKGLNVTSPFKEEICNYVDELEYPASLLKSVNTIIFGEKGSIGYNTDVNGFEKLLSANNINPWGKKFFIIGSGGAAAAAAYVLINAGAEISVCSRSIKKSEKIAANFKVGLCHWMSITQGLMNADYIVNCIPRGINVLENASLKKTQAVIDANYGNTILKEHLNSKEIKYTDGKDWLTGQARPAFELFLEEDIYKEIEFPADNTINIDIITLTGFMGSGKSVTGDILARELGYEFYDIDKMIEINAGKDVVSIFDGEGEPYFRRIEAETIKELYTRLSGQKKKAVVSLGGGAVMNEETRNIASAASLIIWLYSSLESCIERLNPGTRPLLHTENPLESAKKIFAERVYTYAGISGLVINTSQEPQRTSSKIIRELNSII